MICGVVCAQALDNDDLLMLVPDCMIFGVNPA